MAKLSTPYHPCKTRYVDGHGAPTGHGCPRPAYRKYNGEWTCRVCTASAKRRAARTESKPAFEVIAGT